MLNLLRKAHEAGITIEYCNIPLNESLSVQDRNGDFVLLDYSLRKSDAKRRVHLGHEIGHSIKGAYYNPYAAFDIRQKHEHTADKWAINEIIPADKLDEAVADGHTEIWDLAEQFGVTEEFMRKAVCWYTYGNLATELYF